MTPDDFKAKHQAAAKAGALAEVVRLMHRHQLTLDDLTEYAENGIMEGDSKLLQRHRERNAHITNHREALTKAQAARKAQTASK